MKGRIRGWIADALGATALVYVGAWMIGAMTLGG